MALFYILQFLMSCLIEDKWILVTISACCMLWFWKVDSYKDVNSKPITDSTQTEPESQLCVWERKREKWQSDDQWKRPNIAWLIFKTERCRGRGGLGIWNWHVHTVIFKIDNQQGPTW